MKTRQLTRSALMLALLIVCSQLSLPIGPVPITLQTFAVLLITFKLSPLETFTCTSLYLILGLIGLPIFSNMSGGLQSLLSPSFGFVLSFIPASSLGAYYLKQKQPSFRHYIEAGLLFSLVNYSLGLIYLGFILNVHLGQNTNLPELLSIGLIPFIPGDIIKLILATLVAQKLPN